MIPRNVLVCGTDSIVLGATHSRTAAATDLDDETPLSPPLSVTVVDRTSSIVTISLPVAIAGRPSFTPVAATAGEGPLSGSLDAGSLSPTDSTSPATAPSPAPHRLRLRLFDVRVADSDPIVAPADEDARTFTLAVLTPRRGTLRFTAQPIRSIAPPPAPVTLASTPTHGARSENTTRFNNESLRLAHSAAPASPPPSPASPARSRLPS